MNVEEDMGASTLPLYSVCKVLSILAGVLLYTVYFFWREGTEGCLRRLCRSIANIEHLLYTGTYPGTPCVVFYITPPE